MRKRLSVAIVFAVAAVAVVLAPSFAEATRPVAPRVAATGGGAPHQTTRPSVCAGVITATVTTATLPACTETEVKVDIRPECPVCAGGIAVIFVQLAMAQESSWQNSEAIRILDEVERYVNDVEPPSVRMAVVHYDGSGANVRQRLTDDFSRVRSSLNAPNNGYIPQGDAERAAQEAVRQLRDARRETDGGQDDMCELVVMFAHVKEHDPHASNLERAGQIIRRETRNFLVGCPIESGAWYCEGPEPEMPHSRRDYTKYPESAKLLGVARNIIREWSESDVTVRSTQLVQSLPVGLDYVPDSASVAPADVTGGISGTRITWNWALPAAPQPQSVTYRVRPMATGAYSVTGELVVEDSGRLKKTIPLEPAPVIVADVSDCPEGTPVPTNTPQPTVTNTSTPTATAPPTATPTRSHYIIYLPITLGEHCDLRRQRADVVLVLDVSTSMLRLTSDGQPKMAAAQDAARAFVAALQLEPDEDGGYDQIAVVGFNREAWIEQSLTSDGVALEAAIANLPAKMREYTRLDLALIRGAEALDDPARRSGNAGVMVFMTDGLPNQVPAADDGTMETTVLRAAADVKAAGHVIYTVGLGNADSPDIADRINPALLRAVASEPEMYYETLHAEDLRLIYAQIAVSIGCPPGRHNWMDPWP
jgi:Mg-chelatase subunit ChlD